MKIKNIITEIHPPNLPDLLSKKVPRCPGSHGKVYRKLFVIVDDFVNNIKIMINFRLFENV